MLNGPFYDGIYSEVSVNMASFRAGERVSMKGDAGILQLQIPIGFSVDVGTSGDTLSWIFTENVDSTSLFWSTSVAETGWTVSCSYVGLGDLSDAGLGDASGSPGPYSIPSWVQAYGRASANATCIDGWASSWQKWAEPVTGGWVCTRSIPSLG